MKFCDRSDAEITPQAVRSLLATLAGIASRDVLQEGVAATLDSLISRVMDRAKKG
jgi:hypothetical protein